MNKLHTILMALCVIAIFLHPILDLEHTTLIKIAYSVCAVSFAVGLALAPAGVGILLGKAAYLHPPLRKAWEDSADKFVSLEQFKLTNTTLLILGSIILILGFFAVHHLIWAQIFYYEIFYNDPVPAYAPSISIGGIIAHIYVVLAVAKCWALYAFKPSPKTS